MERDNLIVARKTSTHDHRVQMQSASPAPVHSLLALQRSVGNQSVHRLIRSPFIQAKLQVSEPADESEREADRVADTVMRMRQPDQLDEDEQIVAPKSKSHVPVAVREDGDEEETPVQRVCDECEEEMVHSAEGEEDEEAIQREVAGTKSRPSTISHSVAKNINSLNGHGSPIPETTRSFFEPRFGTDFSQVRVHRGSQASETARSINAKAFTVGPNIAFGSGQYAPHSHEGQKILAHELTHVLQQSGSHNYLVPQSRETSLVPPHVATIHPGLVQRDDKGKSAQTKRAKVEAAMLSLKTKYGLADVSEENGVTWTERELKTVDASFAKMSTEEQARLKGLSLIKTDKLSVERKGKKIKVVGMATAGWIRLTKKAFSGNMVILHEAGHVIHHKVAREVEDKLRKSQVFTDLETALNKFNDVAAKNKHMSGTSEQMSFARAIDAVTAAAKNFANSAEGDRQAKQDELLVAEIDADTARSAVERNKNDNTSKILLNVHDLQRSWTLALRQWMDEKAKVVAPREKLTEFVDIVIKNNLARKSFKPFTSYVAKFWPDEPGEFFAESYATWRANPSYMKKNARPLFDWFEKKAHLP